MDRTIGTCSLCGGPVTVPGHWMATVPPTPTCTNCGATAAPNYGKVIPMQPASQPQQIDFRWNVRWVNQDGPKIF